MTFAIYRPNPVPSFVVVKYGSNIRPIISLGIAPASSPIFICALFSFASTCIVIFLPFLVETILVFALFIMFKRTCLNSFS